MAASIFLFLIFFLFPLLGGGGEKRTRAVRLSFSELSVAAGVHLYSDMGGEMDPGGPASLPFLFYFFYFYALLSETET